jgi:tRNA nucleotidyltransferase/poly(A) polymerase
MRHVPPSTRPLRSFQVLLHHPVIEPLLAACGGTECHLVGGALRDRALGLPIKDVDAVVAGRGREIAQQVAATLPGFFVALGGKEFAAFRVVAEGFELDLWDRAGTTLFQDLERRDFTVNSIALDARTGEITDPFGGLGDLVHRILRATTPASFAGDPLRVLRLPRMLLRLPGFSAEPETVRLARQCSPRLAEVAAERVREELTALFSHAEAHHGLALLIGLDLYPGLWLGAPGEPGPSGSALRELEELPARVLELRQLEPAAADGVQGLAARFSALFRNLPDPAGSLRRFRDAGYLLRKVADEAALLLSWDALPDSDLGRRHFLHRAGDLWATAACALGARAAARGELDAWRSALSALVELVRQEGGVLFDPPRLVNGAEVQELLGLPPGPGVGKALAAVLAAQVEGRIRTREEAIELVHSLRT